MLTTRGVVDPDGDGGGKGMVEEKGDLRGKEREVVGTVNAREMKVRMEEDDGRHREDYDTSETRAPQDNATEKVGGHQQRLRRRRADPAHVQRPLHLVRKPAVPVAPWRALARRRAAHFAF